MELWKNVRGYKNLYLVSNRGRAKSTNPRWKNHKILKQVKNQQGYYRVGLWKDGKQKSYSVHLLVLEAFHGPRPYGREACHNDGTRTNNRSSNLRWDTHKNNKADMKKHGTYIQGTRSPGAKLNEKQVIEIFKNPNEEGSAVLSKRYGVSTETIRSIWKGKYWGWLTQSIKNNLEGE